ncbi:tetraacyldisaccharide 4'-kinase [Thioflexithrix psekupsensis]|uniref:Tetraacyldisaccharide 4'-kinase n=1 Tax=Thioflexithrix psekupsensis TaxID=1570016 RepID=A0A251XBT9_9GAMM|nr:tetraacyldisaccharide 4'-kinase [Thioflexithrix psekupsensis]OUD15385.1 tetraacyldisaccharide 4'-kinase [Thioflexithrix psekupsensis]
MNVDNIWYSTNHPFSLLLAPLSWLYCGVAAVRRQAYHKGLLKIHSVPVPVIVVGNITVGGTGKTPLVIWLAQFLKSQGFQPGIVSRGYGGQRPRASIETVVADSDPVLVGDEPILLARHSGCPVVVGVDRLGAVERLLAQHPCNVIISDDGLQHYRLGRDIEIAVLDDIRRYGNRRCLPAGPLREPVSRLENIDFLVTKGATLEHEFSIQYTLNPLQNIANRQLSMPLDALRGQTVHAIAGIGHPEKFFNRLRDHGLKLKTHIFPDHYVYQVKDIKFKDNLPVIMTEKDAVKCEFMAASQHWYLPITARLPEAFGKQLLARLHKRNKHGQKAI